VVFCHPPQTGNDGAYLVLSALAAWKAHVPYAHLATPVSNPPCRSGSNTDYPAAGSSCRPTRTPLAHADMQPSPEPFTTRTLVKGGTPLLATCTCNPFISHASLQGPVGVSGYALASLVAPARKHHRSPGMSVQPSRAYTNTDACHLQACMPFGLHHVPA
jgi:hypothetical protein